MCSGPTVKTQEKTLAGNAQRTSFYREKKIFHSMHSCLDIFFFCLEKMLLLLSWVNRTPWLQVYFLVVMAVTRNSGEKIYYVYYWCTLEISCYYQCSLVVLQSSMLIAQEGLLAFCSPALCKTWPAEYDSRTHARIHKWGSSVHCICNINRGLGTVF